VLGSKNGSSWRHDEEEKGETITVLKQVESGGESSKIGMENWLKKETLQVKGLGEWFSKASVQEECERSRRWREAMRTSMT